jgi:AraC-like DNA-binding protein
MQSTSVRKDYYQAGHHFGIDDLQSITPDSQILASQDRLTLYEFIWLKSAEGTIIVDHTISAVRQQAVYCFLPGQVRHFHFTGRVCGFRLSFSREFLFLGSNISSIDNWLDEHLNPAVPVIIAGEKLENEIDGICRKMQEEVEQRYLLHDALLSGLLNMLMIYFSRNVTEPEGGATGSGDRLLVSSFKSLLKQRFIEKKQVADYADELCVTANYLNRTVKKITGITASHHIQQQIILEAKRMAIYSNESMKQIAYRLGFDDLAHFSKFFKNKSGMSFTCFKKASLASRLAQ